MTTRRGFMGIAAALGLGGPEIARTAINGNVGIPVPPQTPVSHHDFFGDGPYEGQLMEKVSLPREAQIALIKANPALMEALIENIKANQIHGLNYGMLDPDLEAYKSFSRSAKNRIQHERNLKRAVERTLSPTERNWFWRVLEKAGIDL